MLAHHDLLTRAVITKNPQIIASLEQHLSTSEADVVIAGKLIQRWQSGEIRRCITFEHKDGGLSPLADNPPVEHGPFLKIRWNPFYGLFVANEKATAVLSKYAGDHQILLKAALKEKLRVHILPDIAAEEYLRIDWKKLSLHELTQKSKWFRAVALPTFLFLGKLKRLLTEGRAYREYQRKIAEVIKKKELVLDFDLGGLGDCLCYTTLPRLLKETHDVDFYLSENTKKVFRHPDNAALCFESNPYFKGYKAGPAFKFEMFARDFSWYTFLTDKGGCTAVGVFEKQFNLPGDGNPELYYQPKKLPGYENTLLCDTNWHSGEKWGLYNDPRLLEGVLADWKARGDSYKVEYNTTGSYDIYTYLDKVYSARHFVCYYSGGNALAAALKKTATVIVPENLEGYALAIFFFRNAPITYRRTKSLKSYY